MNMFERHTYEKEKRKKRLTLRHRQKMADDYRFKGSKRHLNPVIYEDRFLDNRELFNSR